MIHLPKLRKRVQGLALALTFAGVTCNAEPAVLSLDGASWIWSARATAPSPPAGTVYFRTHFAVTEQSPVVAAEVLITADNLFELHLNGQFVGESTTDPDAWNQPRRFNVADLVKAGGNVIAVGAANTASGPAGLLVQLRVRLADGQEVNLASDAGWKCSDTEQANWQQADADDQAWPAARVVGAFGVGPWGRFSAPAAAVPPGKRDAESETAAPADFAWPDGVVFVGDDCSLYRGTRPGTAYDSLSVTIFNPGHTRAFPEHDLPAPMKVGRQLCALRPARPGVAPTVLLDAGAGALGSPSVSFDGAWILFSMAPAGEPFYHLYRIPATGGAAQQLTDGPFHDIDPVELPDGRIAFTSTRIGTYDEYHAPPSRALFVMPAAGGEIGLLTSTFVFDNEPEVLADGRLLFIRSDNFFDRGKVETLLHATYPDGTHGFTEFGLDLGPEYGNRLRAFDCGSPAPLPDGRVAYLTGSSIAVGRPGIAAQHVRHLRIAAGDVAALPDGRLLCTLGAPASIRRGGRAPGFHRIGVADPDRPNAPPVWIHTAERPLHSPVYLGARARPPQLVPLVREEQATGVLFCQDARFTKNTTAGWPHVRAVRVLAGRGLTLRSSHSYIVHAGSEVVELGTVPLAPDGSFAVEVPADTAIAFQAVDAEGRSELNEMSWITVRPGETRGCVGCHQPRQAAPPARAAVIQALQSAPLKLTGGGSAHRFRGNNAAVTGLMELQFDRFREVAGLNRQASPVTDLIARLAHTSAAERVAAAQRLGVQRDPAAAAALAERLQDRVREVRVAAAVALGACGTRDSVVALHPLTTNEDPVLRGAAVMAVENLTGLLLETARPRAVLRGEGAPSPGAELETAGPPAARRGGGAPSPFPDWATIESNLVARLGSGDRDDVRRAAVALGHTGTGETARAALRDYLARERTNNPFPVWRRGHQGDNARFNALSEANPRTLQAVARAIGRLRDAEAVPLLAETLAQHSDPATGNLFLAEACAEALGWISTPAAEVALLERFAALKDYPQFTSWYGDHSALMACHASPLHYFLMEGLDRIGTTSATGLVPHLIRALPTDTDRALMFETDDYEALTGRLIRRQGAEPAVVETCLALLGDPAGARDPAIADALGRVHGAWGGRPGPEHRAAQVLSLACRDPRYEPRVRAALFRYAATTTSIARVFGRGIPVVNELPVKHWVCFFLARTLGNLADPASVEGLHGLLAAGTGEYAGGSPDPQGPGVLFLHNELTPCWQAAVAWALGQIGDARAAPELMRMVGDRAYAVDTRHAAATALGRLRGGVADAALRELAAGCPEISTRRALLEACQAPAGGLK